MEWLAAIFMGLSRRFYGADKGDFPSNRVLAYALPTSLCMALIFDLWAYDYSLVYFFILWLCNHFSMSLVNYDKYWNVATLHDWQMMALNGMAVLFIPAIFFFALFSFDLEIIKAFTVAEAEVANQAISNAMGLGGSGDITQRWASPRQTSDGLWVIPVPDADCGIVAPMIENPVFYSEVEPYWTVQEG